MNFLYKPWELPLLMEGSVTFTVLQRESKTQNCGQNGLATF